MWVLCLSLSVGHRVSVRTRRAVPSAVPAALPAGATREAQITEGLAAVCTDSQLSVAREIDFLGKPSGSTDHHPS